MTFPRIPACLAKLSKAMAGVNMVHVPYRGDAPALADLLGGLTRRHGGMPAEFGKLFAGSSAASGKPMTSPMLREPRVVALAGETRLRRNALSLSHIVASTLAYMAPAMSFFFGFLVIVQAAGVAAVLTILTAMVVILFLTNTIAEFSRFTPSAGSFVTFTGKAFGRAAVAAAFNRFGSILGPEARRGLGRVLVSNLAQTRTPDRSTLHRSRPELNANFGYLPIENREPGSARFARRAF
jgi:hypothetical protein